MRCKHTLWTFCCNYYMDKRALIKLWPIWIEWKVGLVFFITFRRQSAAFSARRMVYVCVWEIQQNAINKKNKYLDRVVWRVAKRVHTVRVDLCIEGNYCMEKSVFTRKFICIHCATTCSAFTISIRTRIWFNTFSKCLKMPVALQLYDYALLFLVYVFQRRPFQSCSRILWLVLIN